MVHAGRPDLSVSPDTPEWHQTQFVKLRIHMAPVCGLMTNLSFLSAPLYGKKYDFGNRMLLVNWARLSGLVSVITM